MSENARHWRVLALGIGATATGAAGVLGFAGVTASAEPTVPQPSLPAPPPSRRPSPVAPNAAPQAVGQPGVPATGRGARRRYRSRAARGARSAAGHHHPGHQRARSRSTSPPRASPSNPRSSRDFRALNIVLPMPRGWTHIPDPNVPDAFAVIADRVGGNGLYSSNAQVVVYKLVGEFDPKEAISHGFIDSQQLPAWRSTDASLAEYGGLPSSLIEGTYRENTMTLNTSRRNVIAASGPDQYLVSLAVTTSVDQVVAAADATEAIVKGFKVSAPSALPAAPPAAAPARRAAAPAVPPVAAPPPQLLGLQG